MAHNLNAVDGCRSYLTLFGAVGAGVVGVCVEIKFHGAFVLNRRFVLRADTLVDSHTARSPPAAGSRSPWSSTWPLRR